MVMVKVTDIYDIVTERNENTMIDIKQIKALSAREAEITETLTFAKKELDKTGSAVLPYSLYHALCEERKQIREQLEQMMKQKEDWKTSPLFFQIIRQKYKMHDMCFLQK